MCLFWYLSFEDLFTNLFDGDHPRRRSMNHRLIWAFNPWTNHLSNEPAPSSTMNIDHFLHISISIKWRSWNICCCIEIRKVRQASGAETDYHILSTSSTVVQPSAASNDWTSSGVGWSSVSESSFFVMDIAPFPPGCSRYMHWTLRTRPQSMKRWVPTTSVSMFLLHNPCAKVHCRFLPYGVAIPSGVAEWSPMVMSSRPTSST